MRPEPGEHVLHYRIERKLGEGGMGEVWLARDTRLERPVALKFLARKAALEPEARERLAREARAASALNHPSILTIYAVETVDDTAFIAMEFADGMPLDEWTAEHTPDLDQLLDLATQIAEGLGAAHGKGIIHRDVKPNNVMVTAGGRAQVMDFGLAKVSTEPQLTQTGSTLGTLAYMSPEQVKGQQVDPRSDQFSFAALLYELVDGRSPFHREEGAGAVLHAILNDAPAPLAGRHGGVPADLDRVLGQALAKDRDERYASMQELVEDLRALRDRRPVAAPAPASARRGPLILALAATAVAVAAGVWIATRPDPAEGGSLPAEAGVVASSEAGGDEALAGNADAEPAAPPGTPPTPHSAPPRYTQRLLSTLSGSPHSGTMNAEGSMVAYVNAYRGVDQLYVTGVDDGEPRRLTEAEANVERPRWQPGGNQILYQHTPSGEAWADGEVFTISALGGTPRRCLEAARRASWSADGNRIVFERGLNLWVADADGDNQTKLEGLPPAENPVLGQMPALSPDGERVAFIRSDIGPTGGVWIANLDGSDLRPLSDRVESPSNPSFTPDGRWVVYSSERSGPRLLWRVSTSPGGPFPAQAITTGTGADSEPCVAADGRRILFTNARTESVVQVWDPALPDSAPRILRASRSSLLYPTWSPQGDRIAAFGEGRQGSPQVFTLDAGQGDMVQLTDADAEDSVLMPFWSADGASVFFYREAGPAPGLCRLGIDGGSPEVVRPEWRMKTHPFPAASADGRSLLSMQLHERGMPTSVLFDLESGREEPFEPPLFRADYSETGERIVGEWPPGSLTLVETESGRRTPLGKGQVARFAGDGASVLFLSGGDPIWELWAVGYDGGNRRKLRDLGEMFDLSPWVDVSRFGEVVWSEHRSSPRELWVLDEQ